MTKITLPEADEIAKKLIRSAKYSVSLGANLTTSFAFTAAPFVRESALRLLNVQRILRFAVGTTHLQQAVLEKIFLDHGQVQDTDWEIRVVKPLERGENYLIVDDEIAVVSRPGGQRGQGLFFLIQDQASIRRVAAQFNAVWDAGVDVRLLYSDPVSQISSEQRDELVRVSRFQWDRIIVELQRRPEHLFSVDPQRFEELIAELLDRDGMEVQLTPRSSDGGKDIIARMDTPLGKHLYYVECKRYSRENPVGVQLVRQLYGVVSAAGATAGLLVTTSNFTKNAVAFTQSTNVQNRLSLKDYGSIVDWLNKHAQ